MKKHSSTLVYSTDAGKAPKPTEDDAPPAGDGIIRIRLETKGRNGKGVSVVWGFDLDKNELKALAKKLKAHCGTGGSVKDWTIEIQGDQREKLKAKLEALRYEVKLAGG